MIILLTLYQRGKVGGGVEGGAVRLEDDTGRNLLLVAFLLNLHHQSALTFHSIAAILQVLDHIGDVGFGVAFALPQVKVHIQVGIVLFQVSHGHIHNMVPDGHIASFALLQLQSSFMGTGGEFRILFAAGGGGGVDLFQLTDGERRLGGIFAVKIGVEVGKLRLRFPDALDDQTHLQTPVTQMHVTNDVIAEVTLDALDGLADDGRTDVTHMQGFCHVGSAVVNDHGFGLGFPLQAELFSHSHPVQVLSHKFRLQPQVDEAGLYCLHCGESGIFFQTCHNFLCDHQGRFLICLGGPEGAIALIFAQIRTTGNGDLTVSRVIALGLKYCRYPLRNQINEFFHFGDSFPVYIEMLSVKTKHLIIAQIFPCVQRKNQRIGAGSSITLPN